MVTVSNLQDQPLMTVDGGKVLNHQGQTIARYKGAILYNLQGQVVCTVVEDKPKSIQGKIMATIQNDREIVSAADSVVGYVSSGDVILQAIAAGAWIIYFAS